MSSACIICHKRKIKCDLSVNDPCSNCKKTDHECRPHTRKRKKYTNSLSPPRDARRLAPKPIHTQQLESASPGSYNNAVVHDASTNQLDSCSPTGLSSQAEQISKSARKQGSYMGREEYLPGSIPSGDVPAESIRSSSNTDIEMLRQQKAFEMPPKVICDHLINSFMQFCEPWTPILDPAWLNSGEQSSSPLLQQAIFLAGSRVLSTSLGYASSEEFYRRAKLLFFFGSEANPIISVVAATVLQWYNPVGPENISTDTSGFWIRTAGAIAFQIGLHKEPSPEANNRILRRRLWWSLVIRDNIISVGTGRPRTINLKDSDVAPPSLCDFPVKDHKARLFLAYVQIIQLLGDITECCLRKSLTSKRRLEFENALFRWIKQLPADLRIFTSSEARRPYSLDAYQLQVAYFAIIIILYRSPSPLSPPSAASLVASSFIAGIFQEFLAKDEICHLGPVFTFYALCAGLSLVPAYRYPSLRSTAEYETSIIKLSLQELSKQWASAVGSLHALRKVIDQVLQQTNLEDPLPTVSPETVPFFEDFGPALCRQWPLVIIQQGNETADTTSDHQALFTNYPMDSAAFIPGLATTTTPPGLLGDSAFSAWNPNLNTFEGSWEGSGFDWSGSWLLSDWIG